MATNRRAADPDLKRELLWSAFGMIVFSIMAYVGMAIFFKAEIPEGLKTLLAIVVGNLLNNFKDAFSFVFGSSQSSQAKDTAVAASAGALATIAAANAPATTTTTTVETKPADPAPLPAAPVAPIVGASESKPATAADIKTEVTEALHEAEPVKATLVEIEPKPKEPPNA